MVGFLAVFAVLIAAGVWLGARLAQRLGARPWRERPPAQRRALLLTLAVMLPLALLPAWAITSGHPVIGIGVLVATFVLPEFVLLPLRIRRSRRRADEARARRTRASH